MRLLPKNQPFYLSLRKPTLPPPPNYPHCPPLPQVWVLFRQAILWYLHLYFLHLLPLVGVGDFLAGIYVVFTLFTLFKPFTTEGGGVGSVMRQAFVWYLHLLHLLPHEGVWGAPAGILMVFTPFTLFTPFTMVGVGGVLTRLFMVFTPFTLFVPLLV